jgi:LysM domain
LKNKPPRRRSTESLGEPVSTKGGLWLGWDEWMAPYIVQKNDSVWRIARNRLGDSKCGPEIVRVNRIDSGGLLMVGQVLDLPERSVGSVRPSVGGGGRPSPGSQGQTGREESSDAHSAATCVPARAFLFVLSDEVLPSAKLVRKVLMVPVTNADYVAANPELFSFTASDPEATVSLGEFALNEQALNRAGSQFISASSKPGGAPKIAGRPAYIGVAKAEKAGVPVHSTAEIADDLDRLAGLNPARAARLAKLKGAIESVEGEALLEGARPAAAI